ncbi:RES family NAD+ phosphorylase [Entomohabitans teleogrylli]|uniref:RES family NAD+ phosphorylase n=1 Tax=Entomohabitans teleogrylli TaxID=1384589 RepID=UPI00073D8180|nr:RES family NAD+ phosphorylase [Entomohabitans teleogrylli]
MAEHETACQLPFPEPPASALIKTALWPAGKPIERIHSTRLAGALFNPGYGSARFSPLTPAPGVTIPTLYGAESIDVALMETLLHDLPLRCAGLGVELSKLQALTHSQLIAREDLALLDVNPRTLKKLGITQYQLLGSGLRTGPTPGAGRRSFTAIIPRLRGCAGHRNSMATKR